MSPKKKSELRKKAEERLKQKDTASDAYRSKDAAEIIHELTVHQMELEIQNEELRKIQEDLTASRDRFLRLFHRAPVGYVVLDELGMILDANETFCRMLGCDTGKLKGKGFSDLFDDDDRKSFLGRFKALFKDPAGKELIAHAKTSMGQSLVLRMEGTLIDYDGTQRLMLAVSDITERKRNERELQFRARKNELLMKASRAVLENRDFMASAKIIFDICKELTGATAGYVALMADKGDRYDVIYLDSGDRPCTVDPDLPMPIRGLRAEAYRNIQSIFENDFQSSPWLKFIPEGHVRLDNVLFAPLVIEGKAVGLIGLANKPKPFDEEDVGIVSAFADIAAMALMNSQNLAALQASLKEREILLRELQHRVKNSFAMITGLILLTEERISETFCRTVLKELRGRVDTVSQLYSVLYLSGDTRNVKLDEFFSSVLRTLTNSIAPPGVKVEHHFENITAHAKDAAAWGILLNELVTNAFKYAFTGGRTGRLVVDFLRKEGTIVLSVSDDGVGLPDDFDLSSPKGFGMRIINLMVKQLRGGIEVSQEGRTTFIVRVPERTTFG
jgi:PAS domain S-box-containing protein